ncbi:NAD(P)H-dependent oxidoreductase [Patulibacter sp. NPDC049589]|uniref:FMN-dependent NADH-azoreductase n=1 Tax=Patulibacter sp. NPDC049589 TaxID=3154731 RepID=UPI0034351456
MPSLLHLDSSLRTSGSRSRRLSADYVDAWRAANPDGTVRYRDLAADPVPHMDEGVYVAHVTLPGDLTDEQREQRALGEELAHEVLAADVIVLGAGLYNFTAPSTVRTWIDRILVRGITVGADGTGALGGKTLVLALASGGGYGPGTPRHGWDHREPWIRHVFEYLGLTDVVVASAELTLARESPAMVPLDLGHAEDQSLAAAQELLVAHAATV